MSFLLVIDYIFVEKEKDDDNKSSNNQNCCWRYDINVDSQ